VTARIIDGKAIAADLRSAVAAETRRLTADHGLVPGLAVVLVGDNPASKTYVASKSRGLIEVGMRPFDHHLPATTNEADLLALVAVLNADPAVHGILIQLPLPRQINQSRVIAAIDPNKDVDGFHPLNAGTLMIGRSHIVGNPLSQVLLNENATVTIAHTFTRHLPDYCRRAELLCVAIGCAEFIRGDWIKPGATVIDVGINRVSDAAGKSKIVGDVNFAEAVKIAGAITPVPGGVGPMTIVCLLVNTLRAACMQAGLAPPAV
jgi:methylenetetrahydrofolate dehydrogenase (NADP+)/methenyltetrahydrofolate cyclohydrolase